MHIVKKIKFFINSVGTADSKEKHFLFHIMKEGKKLERDRHEERERMWKSKRKREREIEMHIFKKKLLLNNAIKLPS